MKVVYFFLEYIAMMLLSVPVPVRFHIREQVRNRHLQTNQVFRKMASPFLEELLFILFVFVFPSNEHQE